MGTIQFELIGLIVVIGVFACIAVLFIPKVLSAKELNILSDLAKKAVVSAEKAAMTNPKIDKPQYAMNEMNQILEDCGMKRKTEAVLMPFIEAAYFLLKNELETIYSQIKEVGNENATN